MEKKVLKKETQYHEWTSKGYTIEQIFCGHQKESEKKIDI